MLAFKDLIYVKGNLARKPYAIWGLILFFLKYNLDRLLSMAHSRNWFFTDYFVQVDKLGLMELSEADKSFYLQVLLLSLPFIWAGTVLTIKRLRDLSLPTALLIFFFLPFLNILFFVILSLLPSHKKAKIEKNIFSEYIDRMIPKSKWGSAAFALGLLSLFAFPGMIFSVYLMGEYGWGLFVGIPFFIGMGSVLIYSHHAHRTLKESLGVAAAAILLFGGLILLFALEGLICLLMAAPIGFGVGLLGGLLAYYIQGKNAQDKGKVFSAAWLLMPFLILGESFDDRTATLVPVTTTVEVDASKQEVWDELLAFSKIEEPEDWFFNTGIAYPIWSEIKGSGTEAVRYCNFSTGSFVEPIEIWNEPHLLKFSVQDQPPPLVEWSFYDELHLPHLEHYFVSEQGQFLLTAQANGKTKLEGTTWYKHNIWPEIYWKLWSDYILHKIHVRVLEHIKKEAEK